MEPNAPAPATEGHKATRDLMALLGQLLEHGGWLDTADLGERAGVHRDTARRMLRELATGSWVELRTQGAVELWRLGPELPRIGLGFLALLNAEQAALRARFDAVTVPHDWVQGFHGPAFTPTRPRSS